MFEAADTNIAQALQRVNTGLSRLADDIRNRVLRKGIKAAGDIQRATLTSLLAPYVGTETPLRKIRGTNIYVTRPRLSQSVTLKIWRSPSGGFMAIAGPVAVEVPHGHWFESGTKERWTKAGQYRGRMPAYHVFSRAYNASIEPATNAFVKEVDQGISEYHD